MLPNDPLANVLYVDLSAKRSWVEPRPELFERYLGGAGVGAQLLLEECPTGIDPLHPSNPIIFAVGPLTGLFPLASKTVAMFKSPHTGDLGESHAGGRSAVAIREAGYGAIVIRGAFDTPGYLAIHGDQVRYRDARTLWGMQSAFTVGRIIRENEPGAGLRTIMRIGRAGEELVSYAAVTTETYRHFGRLGLGAVFGSKKMKALVVSGARTLPVSDRRAYRSAYDEIYQAAVQSPLMKKYHDLGTPENVLPLQALGGLPTRNLQQTRLDCPDEISGEGLAENHLGRRLACAHCPVACIHIAALREPYEDESYFYKTIMIGYDYELIYALGAMLGVEDAKGLLRLIDLTEAYALDAMSLGVTLAWATEAQGRGLFDAADADGVTLRWGDHRAYMEAIERIVSQPTDLYRALARGVEHASAIYGGREYALAFGKNEMPGYHTGPGAYLGYALGARHSHLDSAGYSIDQKVLPQRALEPEEMVDQLLAEEEWRQVLSSLVICFFARGIYTPDVVSRALAVAGIEFAPEDLKRIGREVHRAKYAFKLREGFRFEDLRLPARILETASPVGSINAEYLRKAIAAARERIEPDALAMGGVEG